MSRLPTYYTFTCTVCGTPQKTRRKNQITCGRPKTCAGVQANRTRDAKEKRISSALGGTVSAVAKKAEAKPPEYWQGFQNGYRAGNRRNLEALHLLQRLYGGTEVLTREAYGEIRVKARRLLLDSRLKAQREELRGA